MQKWQSLYQVIWNLKYLYKRAINRRFCPLEKQIIPNKSPHLKHSVPINPPIISLRYDYFTYFILDWLILYHFQYSWVRHNTIQWKCLRFPRNFRESLHATKSSKLPKSQLLNKLEITKIILFIYDNITVRMLQVFLPFKSFRPNSANTM